MKKYIFGIILLAGLVFTISVPNQSDSVEISLGYSLAFLGYLGLFQEKKGSWPFSRLLLFALVARILMIPFFPNLSDDVYRFYWDALVYDSGLSPYAMLPSEIIDEIGRKDIFNKLNSPDYYSVYPPLNQLLYFMAFKIGGGIQGFSMVLKIEYILLELPGLYFLHKITEKHQNGHNRWFAYSLNPLVVVEGIGNLHIEVVMVSFLVMGIYFLFLSKHLWKGMLFFTAAVGVKIVPLLLGPFILMRSERKDLLKVFGYGLLFMALFFGPILIALDLDTFSQSLDLYFRKFEFNAGLYYVFRYLGYLFLGYNLIAYLGPILSFLVLISIIYFAIKSGKESSDKLFSAILMGWSIYLFFGTIIHPWYIIPLIFFSSISRWKFPVLWSYLITLSYICYGTQPFEENLWLVSLEYAILFSFIIWERRVAFLK